MRHTVYVDNLPVATFKYLDQATGWANYNFPNNYVIIHADLRIEQPVIVYCVLCGSDIAQFKLSWLKEYGAHFHCFICKFDMHVKLDMKGDQT